MALTLAACTGTSDVAPSRLASGDFHSCALDADGYAQCWGFSDLGITDAPARPLSAIDAAQLQTCGIADAGLSVLCWGRWPAEHAGDPRAPFVSVHVGPAGRCALDLDGAATCWDADPEADVGLDRVPPGAFRAVDVGHDAACGLRMDGSVRCWGSGGASVVTPDVPLGALELEGSTVCGLDLTGAPAWGSGTCAWLPAGSWSQLGMAGHAGCVAARDGTLDCAGEWFEPGAPDVPVAEIDVGGFHACAVAVDGGVDCWGMQDGEPCDFGQVEVPAELVGSEAL